MAKIVNLKDNANNTVYPVTKTIAVYDENGNNITEICPSKNEKEFLSSEYEKTINLLNVPSNFTINLGERYKKIYIKLKKNTVYHIQVDNIVNSPNYSGARLVRYFNANDEQVGASNLDAEYFSVDFTPTDDVEYVLINTAGSYNDSKNYSSTFTNLLISKGTNRIPYHSYNGAIIHKKDITGAYKYETIYDMNSTDPIINQGNTAGIMFGPDNYINNCTNKYDGFIYTIKDINQSINIISKGRSNTSGSCQHFAVNYQSIATFLLTGASNYRIQPLTANYFFSNNWNSLNNNSKVFVEKVIGYKEIK